MSPSALAKDIVDSIEHPTTGIAKPANNFFMDYLQLDIYIVDSSQVKKVPTLNQRDRRADC